jgi:purine nucleosidase
MNHRVTEDTERRHRERQEGKILVAPPARACPPSLYHPLWALGVSVSLCFASQQCVSAAPAKLPVLLDTDIGGDVDDALALALALSHPRLDLRGVTTVHGDSHTRALIVCRLLHAVGRDDIPVASGGRERASPDYEGQMQYGLRPCFRKRPVKEPAAEFLYKQLKAHPGELTLLAVGPLTNVAELFTCHPDCKPWVRRVVVMGGALRVGYKGKPPAEPEWNVKSDVKAAKAVFASGVPLLVVPLDSTVDLKLGARQLKAIFHHRSLLTDQLEALYQLWGKATPTLFDPAAVALAADESWGKVEATRLEVDDKGMTRAVKGKPNARVVMSLRREAFLRWFVERLTGGPSGKRVALKVTNPAKPVPRGNFPRSVHVVEDYETDIERRWWLAGMPETRDVPAGSTRACRGVLCDDFDDRMGDPRGVYTAVIFNPVPGPPVGKSTRLGFRYRLRGAGVLRVQLYSLSRGYHRHLTLTGLPQGKWQEAAVDMTAARRPDGSGGPLSEGERIDDIQFYTERDAELLVDDVVLYDAAPPGERRPFPRTVYFTGWFDTGRQGVE